MRDALADGRNVGRGAKRDSRAGGGVEDRNALAVSDGDVRATGVHGEYRRGGLVHVLAAPRLAGALVIGARARASLGAGRAVLLLALALTLRHRGCRRVAISIQSWAMERYATATLRQWPPLRANYTFCHLQRTHSPLLSETFAGTRRSLSFLTKRSTFDHERRVIFTQRMEMTAFRPKFLCASLLRPDFRDRPFREKQFVKSVLKSLFARGQQSL